MFNASEALKISEKSLAKLLDATLGKTHRAIDAAAMSGLTSTSIEISPQVSESVTSTLAKLSYRVEAIPRPDYEDVQLNIFWGAS